MNVGTTRINNYSIVHYGVMSDIVGKRPKHYDLTRRQAEILVYIAENGPCSIYHVAQKVKPRQYYPNVYATVKRLRQDHLIGNLEDMRKYGSESKGWDVTLAGLIRSIDLGASIPRLLRRFPREPRKSGEGPTFGVTHSVGDLFHGVCEFAQGIGKDWAEQTSRELLLYRYIQIAEPVMKEIAAAKRGGHPIAIVTFSTDSLDVR